MCFPSQAGGGGLRLRSDRERALRRLLLAAFLVGGAPPAAPASSSMESTDSIHVAIFELDAGTIYVNVPNDLRPGEVGSGTVNPAPAGAEDVRERNRELLRRHGVVLAGQGAPATRAVRTFRVSSDAKALSIVLLDERGEEVGKVEAPLGPAPAGPAGYEVPPIGQSGAPVSIAGSFDGDLSNSSVRIGGQEADPVAESPRQLVVRGPQEGAAETAVEVRERGVQVTAGNYRNVSVRLSAEKSTLRSGETTTLTITIGGVEGLRETLPVRLNNHSPGVVRMEGGEEQTLCVRPDEVGTSGRWTARRGLTGVMLGGFSISTTVSRPRPHAESRLRIPGRLQGELRTGVALERAARAPSGEELAAGAYGVLVRGAGEAGGVSLLLGRQGQLVATLPGAVLKRVASTTLCDRDDVSDAVQRARSGAGEPSFEDLGFGEGEPFSVRDDPERTHLLLATENEEFTIEAELAISSP